MNKSSNDSKERIGTIRLNKNGSKMIVDEYINSSDIWVRFLETNNRVHTTWRNFYFGKVKNVYDKSVHGVGYIGEGDYIVSENGFYSPQYLSWSKMIQRCYDEKYHKKFPTYSECSVSDQWYNFQNFAKWYDENYYEVDGERMELDKDILTKGNKIYSPDNCIFVPHSINTLFLKCTASRGELPIGVSMIKSTKKYGVHYSNEKGKQVRLSGHYYNTPEEAFKKYKELKENVIKVKAEEYKDKIPHKLYYAMMDYKIKIDD
jgi:hypothetical protein